MKGHLRIFILEIFIVLVASRSIAEEKIRIGVSLPPTGYAATCGVDATNAFLFANEKIGKGRYELVFEEDQRDPKAAVSV